MFYLLLDEIGHYLSLEKNLPVANLRRIRSIFMTFFQKCIIRSFRVNHKKTGSELPPFLSSSLTNSAVSDRFQKQENYEQQILMLTNTGNEKNSTFQKVLPFPGEWKLILPQIVWYIFCAASEVLGSGLYCIAWHFIVAEKIFCPTIFFFLNIIRRFRHVFFIFLVKLVFSYRYTS